MYLTPSTCGTEKQVSTYCCNETRPQKFSKMLNKIEENGLDQQICIIIPIHSPHPLKNYLIYSGIGSGKHITLNEVSQSVEQL